MADTDKYTLGDETAADIYGRLSGERQPVVDMGRRMGELTIPSVFPPEDYRVGDNIPGNNQSLSAFCVNTLAAHLLTLAFPPQQPIFRAEPKEEVLGEEIKADPNLWGKTLLALAALERAHRRGIKATTIATAYVGMLKAKLVGGNVLWKHLKFKHPTYHLPTSYVVKRNALGLPLLTIHKETVSLASMDKDHREFILANANEKTTAAMAKQKEWERQADVYSVCKVQVDDKGEGSWLYWEEWEGKKLPGTEVETDFEVPPMYPMWLIPVFGQDWGRGYCEEYRGDLYAMEAHGSAANDIAAAAGLLLGFVKSGSGTSIKAVQSAKNFDILNGDAADLTWSRAEKGSDAQTVGSNMELIARRLSAAFLLQASIQRSGERVTAAEIERLGSDVDRAMGGLYTQTAQGDQKYVILRACRLHEEVNEKLPPWPEDLVDMQVTTGMDALGNNMEVVSLTTFAETMLKLFPKKAETIIDGSDFGTRLAAGLGVKPDGLVRTAEEVGQMEAQAKQEAMAMDAVSKGVGPGIKALSDANMQQPPAA